MYLLYTLIFLVSLLLLAVIFRLLKRSDFCIELHCLGLFDFYVVNLTLFIPLAISFNLNSFVETLTIVVANTLCCLAVLHLLFREANVGDTGEYARRREKMILARQQAIAVERELLAKNMREKARKARKNSLKILRENNLLGSFLKNAEKDREIREAEKARVEAAKNAAPTTAPTGSTSKTAAAGANAIRSGTIDPNNNPVTRSAQRESAAVSDDIKEQKKALKKKIETARKNAFITRKPEKIAETEKIIKEILDKYGLTEEMLDED